MNDYRQKRSDINRLFNAPQFRKLKYAALIVIGAAIATMLAAIIWIDYIPYKTMLLLRGFVGLGAIIFVTLVALLTYKVYSEYYHDRNRKK